MVAPLLTTSGIGTTGRDADEVLDAVRRRAVRLASLAFTAAGLAGVAIIAAGSILGLAALVNLATTLRQAIGIAPPAEGRDWYLLSLTAVAIFGPLLVLWWAAGRYRRRWRERVNALWDGAPRQRRFSRVGLAGGDRGAYLQALVVTPTWQRRWDELAGQAGVTDFRPQTVLSAERPALAEALLSAVERDVARRATVTGLAVGISRQRWLDTATIVAGALELQLAVLTQLGKRPSLRIWWRLARNAGASVFVNTYLNRQDVFLLHAGIRQAAMGLEAVAAAVEEGREAIASWDLDEALDTVFDVVDIDGGSIGGVVARTALYGVLLTTGFGLGVGEVGLRQLASLTESLADDLLQAVLAAGLLYHHGMGLAADVLAADEAHRQTPAMRRNLRDGAEKVSAEARALALEQVQLARAAWRLRRKAALAQLARSDRTPKTVRRQAERVMGGDVAGTTASGRATDSGRVTDAEQRP